MEGKFSSHGPVPQDISCDLAFVWPSLLAEGDELRTSATLLLRDPKLLEAVCTSWQVGGKCMHKCFSLRIFQDVVSIQGGNDWGTGMCVSCVQKLTRNMSN